MKSVLTYGISCVPVRRREGALAEARAAEAAVRDRVERLDDLVALAVLPQREAPVSGQKTLWLVHGWSQIVIRSWTWPISRSATKPPATKSAEPDRDVGEARGRDVEHREEDPEVEERRAEVVRLDEDEHRRAPDQRAAGRGPSAAPGRAPRASRAGRRRGRRSATIFASSPGWNWNEPTCTQSRAPLTVVPMHGQARQEEQHDRADAEQVLVRLEHAVVAAEPDQRGAEEGDADHDPEALLEGVGRIEPVDLGQPDAVRSPAIGRRYGSAFGTVMRAITCATR